MRQLLSGTDEGFSRFYQRFAPGLYSIAFRILGEQKDAEDVLQEAFVQMWRKTDTYDSTRSSLFTWAVMITRNKAIDRIRTRQSRQRTIDAATNELSEPTQNGDATADAAITSSEARQRVRGAMATLPESQRDAIDLAFFGGLTQTQIADKIGAPLGTVKARIRRGMLAMRDLLQSKHD